VLLVAQGVLPAATVSLTRRLIDSFVAAIGSNGQWERLQPTLLIGAVMAGVLLLSELLKNVLEWVHTAQTQVVQDHLYGLIHAKAASVDLAFYETPDHFDRLRRAHKDTSHLPVRALESCGSLFQNSITLLSMGALLLPYGLWIPLVLALSTLPALWTVLHFNREYHDWWERTTADWRRVDYYDAILTQSEFATELRLFNLGSHFRSAHQALRRRLRVQGLELARKRVLSQFSAGMMGILVFGSAMIWIGWRAVHGFATLGDLALFYQAFDRGQMLMRAILDNLGRIYSHSLFLGNLFEFLAIKPQIVDPPVPKPVPSPIKEGIVFQGVNFRYPGSEELTLRDFNLSVPPGQIVAIVGANGAGKSTLVKLLCRFYNFSEGHVAIDGIDIRDFSVRDLRRNITVLFQKPVSYQATASENVALGDLALSTRHGAVQMASRRAGAHEMIARLPFGYDTVLGKWFAGGTELSGGEWQRVALARAFFRKSSIVILDEPTSAMDSWAEIEWLERFRKLVEGQTAIIITHRFTTAMRADIIHVMNRGQILETGRHRDLMAQNGLYAKSWRAQMRAAARLEDGEPESFAGRNDSLKNVTVGS
jgi:ATP-binding cassette, subfamily B, bacterial